MFVDIFYCLDVIIVSGEKVVWLFNIGIFIDFFLEIFLVGIIIWMIFYKVLILIWCIGENMFVVEVWVLFMEYVVGIFVNFV